VDFRLTAPSIGPFGLVAGIFSTHIRRQEVKPPHKEDPMAFKPNYRRDRAERQRAARARSEEKQRKKDEKVLLRKAERDAAEVPPDDKAKLTDKA
jgi:hypothetical protein